MDFGERYEKADTENGYNQSILYQTGNWLIGQMGEELSIVVGEGERYPFEQIWGLLCLYHDYGIRYERQTIAQEIQVQMKMAKESGRLFKNDRREYYKTIGTNIQRQAPDFPLCYWNCFLRPTHIKMHRQEEEIWREKFCSGMCKGDIRFENGLVCKKGRYGFVQKSEYLYQQLQTESCLNHGIIGADYMFQKLMEQKNNCEVYKIIIYLADCLANHALHMTDKERVIKIAYEDNPILFLLCLSDAVQPNDAMPEGTEISYSHVNRELTVMLKGQVKGTLEGERYRKKIADLDMEIAITVKICIM